MAGYTRQESYIDGDIILAADSNNEFDAQVTAFNSTGAGHRHDGTVAEGSGVPVITDADNDTFIKVEETSDIDRINFNIAASSDILKMTASEVTFNEDGNDTDFRIESSTNAAMFDLDAGQSAVGIGTAAGSTHLLDIGGTVNISGAITGAAASSFLSVATSSNADIGQNITVGETLQVTGVSSFTAGVEMADTLTVDGASSFLSIDASSDVNVAQNFSVGELSTFTGAVTMKDTLSVEGASSFLSIETSSDAVIDQNLSVGEQSSLVGSVYMSSITYLQGSAGTAGQVFTSRGTTGESEWVTATAGATELSGLSDVSVRSTGVADADLLVYTSTGGVFYDQTLSGDGTINNAGVLTVTQSAGNFVVNGTLQATGATTFLSVATSSDVDVGQNLTVGETFTVDGASSFLSIATSSNVDIAQNLTVGETLSVEGASSFSSGDFSSNVTLDGTLSVAGASSFLSIETSSNVTIDQNLSVGETLSVTGASSFSSVDTSSNITIGGNVDGGTWQGTAVAIGFGGTGSTNAATALTNLGGVGLGIVLALG